MWRLITFNFLHANFLHIVINLFSQIIIGSFLESTIGKLKIAALYLCAGIGGGVFSCLVSNSNGVGASVAIFGMLGAYLGFILMNWKALDRIQGPTNKFFNLIFMLMIILLNISIGFTNPMIDNYGHIGGLIYGFFLIFLIHSPYEPNDGMCCRYKIWFWISLSVLLILFVGGLVLFYTVRQVY